MKADPRPWAAGLRKKILAAMTFMGPVTAEQIAAKMNPPMNVGAVRPRLTELAQIGAVRDTGGRVGHSGPGRKSIVWELAL
jgi:predicted ArsR family transcriptional regulator